MPGIDISLLYPSKNNLSRLIFVHGGLTDMKFWWLSKTTIRRVISCSQRWDGALESDRHVPRDDVDRPVHRSRGLWEAGTCSSGRLGPGTNHELNTDLRLREGNSQQKTNMSSLKCSTVNQLVERGHGWVGGGGGLQPPPTPPPNSTPDLC